MTQTLAITIGVLALQGAFSEHLQLLRHAVAALRASNESTEVSWAFIEVRTPEELAKCDALIIPGGESTTISLVAQSSGLLEPLREFVKYVFSKRSHLDNMLTCRSESTESPPGAHAPA